MQTIDTAEWVNVLSKGIITIPKKMREKVGIREGDVAKVQVEGNRIIIEPNQITIGEFRQFSTTQIAKWKKEDKLPPEFINKIDELWPELP